MAWKILFICAVAVNCFVMIGSGLNGSSWQYWVSLVCMILAHVAGYGEGERL